jgi:hypothetical protein
MLKIVMNLILQITVDAALQYDFVADLQKMVEEETEKFRMSKK